MSALTSALSVRRHHTTLTPRGMPSLSVPRNAFAVTPVTGVGALMSHASRAIIAPSWCNDTPKHASHCSEQNHGFHRPLLVSCRFCCILTRFSPRPFVIRMAHLRHHLWKTLVLLHPAHGRKWHFADIVRGSIDVRCPAHSGPRRVQGRLWHVS